MLDRIMDVTRRWLESVVQGDKTVIYANQSGPAPGKPFATIMVTSVDELGLPETSPVDDQGNEVIVHDYRAGVSVTFVGETAGLMALAAQKSLGEPDTQELYRTGGLGLLGWSAAQHVPAVRGLGAEDRWVMDLVVTGRSATPVYVGLIEHVKAELELSVDGEVLFRTDLET